MFKNRKKIVLGLIIFLSIAAFYFLYIVREALLAVFYPLFFSILIAYLLNPLIVILENKGIERVCGIIIVYAALILVLTVLGIYIVPLMVSELNNLIEMLPFYTKKVQSIIFYFRKNYATTGLPESIKTVLDENIINMENVLLNILENILNKIMGVFSHFLSLIITPVLGFYILKDLHQIKESMVKIFPQKYRSKILNIVMDIDKTLGHYIRGQIIVSFMVALLITIGLYIIGIKYAVIIGLVAGIANIIPYFGPIIGAIPAVIFAALKGPMSALWALIVFVVVQQIESSIISPKIMQETVGIHPIIVILSLIFGGQLMGFWGMLLAIPVTAIIKVLLKHIISHILSVKVLSNIEDEKKQ